MAEIGDDVLMYKGVVLGTDAVVLGNIHVRVGAKIGPGSVVIREVPAFATVVGIPGRVVRINGDRYAPEALLEHDRLPDPIAQAMEEEFAHCGA